MTALLDRGALLSDFENKKIATAIQAMFQTDIGRANTLYFNGNVMKLDSHATLKSLNSKVRALLKRYANKDFHSSKSCFSCIWIYHAQQAPM